MASIADIYIQDNAWTDVYVASGIQKGTGIIIQNKGAHPILLWAGATAPDAASMNGNVLMPSIDATVDSGEAGCWVKSTLYTAVINVQRGG